MRAVSRVAAALAVAVSLISSVHAISKITRAGRYLYDQSGNRVYIKGVAYQDMCMSSPLYELLDVLIDPACSRTHCRRRKQPIRRADNVH
jgi:1,3-beta-glucanosyltransferase GAS1